MSNVCESNCLNWYLSNIVIIVFPELCEQGYMVLQSWSHRRYPISPYIKRASHDYQFISILTEATKLLMYLPNGAHLHWRPTQLLSHLQLVPHWHLSALGTWRPHLQAKEADIIIILVQKKTNVIAIDWLNQFYTFLATFIDIMVNLSH